MIKFRHILLIAIISVLIYACGSDSNGGDDDYDAAEQSLIDNDSILGFLSNFYYDADVDSIKELTTGETALINDDKLFTQNITEDDVDYTLYYYLFEQGVSSINPETNELKGNPTVVDSVLVNYYGQRIVRTDSISVVFDNNTSIWLALSSTIKGWAYGFTNFKGGENVTNNGPITYANTGKGLLFIPSGLAYANSGSGAILANEPILFNISLLDLVEDTDIDLDGVPSIDEDIDGDGKPWNDDTDEDLIANLFDSDDDGDGVLTIDEDANGDGDPTNDFSDPDNPTIPDYLNFDIR